MGIYKKKLLPIILLILIFPLSAQDSIISYLEGDVTIRRDGIEDFADFGSELIEGDTVSTGRDSLAVIELDGGRVVKLREETILTLTDLGGNTSLSLVGGGVFSRVAKIRGRDFSIKTPTVVAGVRGTEFFISYGRAIEELKDVWLCVNEGSVAVSVPGTDQQVVVEEGEGVNILAGVMITDPEYYPWTDDLNWNTDPEEGPVKDETDLEGAYSDLLDIDYE